MAARAENRARSEDPAQTPKTDLPQAEIKAALEALRAGKAVVYPTETFYALGVDALSAAALEHLFALKKREADKPTALIAADARMAFSLAAGVPAAAGRLAELFWPGPLTLVLPARPGLPQALVGPSGVGVRVSSDPIARALAAALGRPLTATSANLSGEPAATSVEAARASFRARVAVFIDGGPRASAMPSSVVGFGPDGLQIIREGVIARSQLEAAIML